MSSSPEKIEAARRNGAHSCGPTSPEGKARSSRNAVRHGLLAQCVVLENESRKLFRDLVVDLERRFAPSDALELGVIEEMAAACWRLRRAWAIETTALNRSMESPAGTAGASFAIPGDDDLSQRDRLALGWSRLANGGQELNLVHRYETRLHRAFQRSLKTLLLLKNAKFPNEPNNSLKTDAAGKENPPTESDQPAGPDTGLTLCGPREEPCAAEQQEDRPPNGSELDKSPRPAMRWNRLANCARQLKLAHWHRTRSHRTLRRSRQTLLPSENAKVPIELDNSLKTRAGKKANASAP